MRGVRYFDGGAVHEGTLTDDGRVLAEAAPAGTPVLEGLITGRFTDHHVHLQLVDHTLLAGSRLGRVLDLGAEPAWIREVAVHNSANSGAVGAESADSGVARTISAELWTPIIAYAGPFLTTPGGYPSDRAWAPTGSVREITDAADARTAVAEVAATGAAVVKITSHTEAGPVLDDALVQAIVDAAVTEGLLVVAHAEGAGQAQRMARLRADMLAHAPFTEPLTAAEIAEQVAAVSWISTLAVHGDAQRAIAIDNVRRFAAAGGTVLYGTDMGNGDTPVDLREDEITALRDAGVDGLALLTALAPLSPLSPVGALDTAGATRETATPLLLVPDDDPLRARPLTPADLED